ncbi:hypothetical protein [uncultured Pseudokineococcus sp.]|uniref:hypothetical protein n=1 Tax=uncultured Pseudokineococcus sp. TaxID=1642928 RepID=UPI0026374CE6|nr:hypothetical protein [uncultured Pseudokineococcus sp.]
MPSAALLAHSDPHGLVAPHVLRHLSALAEVVDRVVVVSSSPLRPEAERELALHGELVRDVDALGEWSLWRTGIEHLGDQRALDRVVLADEGLVGPLRPLPDVLGPPRPGALRGVTASGPHLSRHLLDVGGDVLRSGPLRAFWTGVGSGLRAAAAPQLLERNLSRAAAASGWQVEPLFLPSGRDRLRTRGRALRRELGRAVTRTGERRAEALRSVRHPPVRLLDPAAVCWYRALDGALPYVRLDVLVEDPEGVGRRRMLSALEQAQPGAMAGVRAHLARVAPEDPARRGARRGVAA